MADTKISALTAVAAVVAANEFAVNEAGTSKKATALQIKTWLNALVFLGRTQLGSNNANCTVSFTAMSGLFKLNWHVAGYTGADTARIQINGDTGANYGSAASEPADAAVTSTTSTSGIILGEVGQTVARSPGHAWVNKPSSGQIAFIKGGSGDGSAAKATAITLINFVGLWDNVAAEISSFTLNGGAGGASLLTGSYLEVYGIKNAASA